MNAVERVIFDVLARRGSVALPGLGSLEVKRRKAHRVSETRVIPPQNVVVFSHDEPRDVPSVVDLLNRRAAMPMDEAWATYNAWMGDARADGALVIEGVGTVRDEAFEPADQLHEMLNPTGAHDGTAAPRQATQNDHPEHASGSGDGYDYGANDDGYGVRLVRRRKCRLWPWWAWVLCAVGLLMLIFGLKVASDADFRRDFLDGLMGRPQRVEAAIEPAVAPTADTVRLTEPVLVPVGPRFHVIAGAFLEPGNADRRIAELRRDYPSLTPEKIQNPNGYEMVSVFSSPSEAEAYRVLNRSLAIDDWMWVYKEQ